MYSVRLGLIGSNYRIKIIHSGGEGRKTTIFGMVTLRGETADSRTPRDSEELRGTPRDFKGFQGSGVRCLEAVGSGFESGSGSCTDPVWSVSRHQII
jgi:hypothetical protein